MVKVALRDSTGRQTTLALTAVGDLLDGGVARSEEEGVVYLPLERSAELLLVNRRHLLQGAAESEEVARAVTEMLLASYRAASDRVVELSVTPARRRIANLLYRLGERYGRPQADGRIIIDLRLSRQDIADLAATTLETAIRNMSSLNRLGVLTADPQGIVIVHADQLMSIGDGSDRVAAQPR
jgi:CRP-like cAMP-binding protein